MAQAVAVSHEHRPAKRPAAENVDIQTHTKCQKMIAMPDGSTTAGGGGGGGGGAGPGSAHKAKRCEQHFLPDEYCAGTVEKSFAILSLHLSLPPVPS